MTVARVVPSADQQLLQRCRVLLDALAEARAEMDLAVASGGVEVVKRCGRRLQSLGWLFGDAVGKHERAS